jgi:two-component system alkaline phosphatase synthesis response regulator PhoP
MSRKTILIVEDEAYIRALLEQTLEPLEEEGVRIVTASDGQEGLDLAEILAPDLVFLDVMMPRLSGFEVCAAIRSNPYLQHTIIAILTARGEESAKQQSFEAGAHFYLNKPFDPDSILTLARQELHRAS